MESLSSTAFIPCHHETCAGAFKYLDYSVHTKIDGPDPRDHFANERNFLTWLRTGMTLALIGFSILVDFRDKFLAPSVTLPWKDDPLPTRTRVTSFIFIGLGFASIGVAIATYLKNQRRIVQRLLNVGHGFASYCIAFLITFFVCSLMAMTLVKMH